MHCHRLIAALALAGAFICARAEAGKATLKNGTVLQGELVPLSGLTERQLRTRSGDLPNTNPYLMVDATYKKYFVSSRQIADADLGQSLIPFDVFTIKQRKTPSGLSMASVGLPIASPPSAIGAEEPSRLQRRASRSTSCRGSRGSNPRS